MQLFLNAVLFIFAGRLVLKFWPSQGSWFARCFLCIDGLMWWSHEGFLLFVAAWSSYEIFGSKLDPNAEIWSQVLSTRGFPWLFWQPFFRLDRAGQCAVLDFLKTCHCGSSYSLIDPDSLAFQMTSDISQINVPQVIPAIFVASLQPEQI